MTDAEIIKALECCTNKGAKCSDCPYYRDDCADRIKDPIELSKYAIDLINRQQKEVENIKKKLQYYLNINEENGVVYIPKFVVDNLVKEIVGEE